MRRSINRRPGQPAQGFVSVKRDRNLYYSILESLQNVIEISPNLTQREFASKICFHASHLCGMEFEGSDRGNPAISPDRDEEIEYLIFEYVVTKGEAINQELWYTLPNGARVCRQTRLLPITGENGSVKSVFYSQVDITELKQKEAGLLRANKKAEEANQIKDKFIELVSHDMRSILSGVTRQLEIEQTADADSMTEFHSKVFQRPIDSNRRLINMIDRLLDIGRLQSGDILPNKQIHELSALLSYSLAWLFGEAEKKGVELVIDIPAEKTMFVDDILFGQLMQNLVGNAIKFCGAGGKVILFIAEGEENIIAVKDTGVGDRRRSGP